MRLRNEEPTKGRLSTAFMMICEEKSGEMRDETSSVAIIIGYELFVEGLHNQIIDEVVL